MLPAESYYLKQYASIDHQKNLKINAKIKFVLLFQPILVAI